MTQQYIIIWPWLQLSTLRYGTHPCIKETTSFWKELSHLTSSILWPGHSMTSTMINAYMSSSMLLISTNNALMLPIQTGWHSASLSLRTSVMYLQPLFQNLYNFAAITMGMFYNLAQHSLPLPSLCLFNDTKTLRRAHFKNALDTMPVSTFWMFAGRQAWWMTLRWKPRNDMD